MNTAIETALKMKWTRPNRSRIGLVVRPMATWAILNSPGPPRRFMNSGMGVRQGKHRLARALTELPNPLDCMNTAELRPTA